MPQYNEDIIEKLEIIRQLEPRERKTAELIVIYWPSGTVVYAAAAYDDMLGYEGLAPLLEEQLGYYSTPIDVRIIPGSRVPFVDLPKTASVGDDKIDLTFSDQDGEFSALIFEHGEGIRLEVFAFWAATPELDDPFDLLLSMWRGSLHAPKSITRSEVKITAAVGFRSPQLQIPRQPNSAFCPFIFGAHLETQAEIDYHQGCPYNEHIGGSIGAPGFTDCPRRTLEQCEERLETDEYWPGINIRSDPIPNNQTIGPNLLAHAIGNQSALGQPIRVIFGYRHAKALILLAFRPEYNNNTPDEAFAAALFEVSKGPNRDYGGFRINDQLVGAEHQQQRLGTRPQTPTDWSPDVEAFAGTGVIWGRIQTNIDNMQVSDVNGSVHVGGLNNIRRYTDDDTFVQEWTTNRMWCLLEMYCNPQWGYGQDYSRVLMESAIDTASWCDDVVAMEDANGNVFGGVRSTCNVELSARPTQQQIRDICTAGRIALPYEWDGFDVFVPLRTESLVDVPEFTDEGDNRNIIYNRETSSLDWTQQSDAEMVNQWTVNYDDATNGFFIDTQLIFGDQIQQLRAGRAWGDRSRRVINKAQPAFGITNFMEAARFGNTLLYLGPLDSGGIANNLKVKFTTWYSECFNVQPNKLIRVLNTKLQDNIKAYYDARFLPNPAAYPWYAGNAYTYFRVMKLTRKGDLRVEIEAQLYPEDYYAALDEPAEVIPCEAAPVGYAGPFTGDAVTTHAATETGQWLVARLRFEDAGDGSVLPSGSMSPTGWTLLHQAFADKSGGGVMWHQVWHRFAPASGAQVFDFGVPGGYTNIVSDVVTVEETHPTLYFWDEKAAQIDNAASDTLTPAAPADADTDGFLVLLFTAALGDPTASIPAGYTELGDDDGLAVHARTPIDTGPIAAPTVTLSANATADLYMLVVKPCTEGGGLPDPPPPPSAPGDPELSLGYEVIVNELGSPKASIHGTVTFPTFHLPLRADVFVSFNGGPEVLIEDNLAPLFGSTQAQFTHKPATGDGEYCFRVTVETAEETPTVGGEVTECIDIVHPSPLLDRDGNSITDRDGIPLFDR